ncbi:DHA2 family efflux MFS transporter permease subunit [Planotetraspora kaengkrachanensis]|uniref:MFS transporter n=1 Tax=Planotetraspora kaengkrachanensis TaxID=575193 RepID=A0A8J3LYW9_9ACTN|nr:DHA2 family efflux MFS transporter permease subunit [Planotetraspora kaengkrachanensis]GIG79280.1 MFS transporter [Planotetraspora kaengkrachanensis]
MNDTRKWGTLVIACLAMLLLSIDLTVLHLAVPKLVVSLNPSATQLLWIADIYGFALAGLLVTMGNVGDRIGRKRLLLIGTVAFGAASVVTAYAPNPGLLIAARALLGVAGATIMPSTLSLIRNVFTDPRQRTTAVGVWSSVSAIGFALGPIIGGALLDVFWWGSVFLINVPVVAIILVAGLLVLPESRNPRPGRIDPVSVPLSVIGVLGLVYALKEAAYHGVAEVSVAVSAVVGLTALVVFVRRQTKLAEPLIDVRLFRRRSFSAAVGAELVAMFALLAMSLVFAQYFQLVAGWTPLMAGLAGMPGGLAGGAGGALAGPLVQKIGRGPVVALGMLLVAVGFTLFSRIGVEVSYPYLLVAMIIQGVGIGFTFAVTNDTVLATAPKERAGAAGAISETAHEIGGALGIAVLGSVLNSAYRNGIDVPTGVPAAADGQIRDTLGGAIEAAATLPRDVAAAVTGAAKQAFVGGIQVTVLTAAGILVCLAVATLFALRGVPKVIPEHEEPAEPAAVR